MLKSDSNMIREKETENKSNETNNYENQYNI